MKTTTYKIGYYQAFASYNVGPLVADKFDYPYESLSKTLKEEPWSVAEDGALVLLFLMVVSRVGRQLV